jgi:putative sigma-54 modulation protein
MNLDITGRHIEITPALRDFTEEKLRKLEKLLDGPLEIHVVLGIEKHRHTAEIQVKSRTTVISGTEETGDLYASIGEVVDKLERQAKKHKEKRQNRRQRKSSKDPEVVAALGATGGTETEGVAVAEVETETGPRIRRSPSYNPRPLSVEDAALELESSGREVLVFRDAETNRIQVVYRRQDGDIGLVEPEG